MKYDLILLHAPSVYDFRKKTILTGPISDVIPSTTVFDMYPIGLTSIAGYLEKQGLKVKIVNLANRMISDPSFDVEKKIKSLNAVAFGVDLHWLPHAHGSIEVAKIVKKYHPDTPVVFGGLSSSYYHEELIDYECIDFVMRGDSTEKLMLQLVMQLKHKNDEFNRIENLTWKRDGKTVINPLTYVPEHIDDINLPDYRYAIKSVFKYMNFFDPLPYNGWLKYPNTALLTARGCTQGCLICGGSRTSYESNCGRNALAKRSPEKLIEDITFIQRFSQAPIFIIHDIRQNGKEYVDEFLDRLSKIELKNELVFELFQYADESFFEQINKAVPKYSIEITLETHDEKIRRMNGKFMCSNEKVFETLNHALKHGCRKIDLFFMVGIPHQTYESALKNVSFCEEIHNSCGKDPRLAYFIAPLAPFLDPASPAFENPELYGYKKLCHTLEDHRNALLQPSWKHVLSYETKDMTRAQIVDGTYQGGLLLNEFKYREKLIDRQTYEDIKFKIEKSLDYIIRIDEIMELPEVEQEMEYKKLNREVSEMNRHVIVGKEELTWKVNKHYSNLFSLLAVGMELLIDELKTAIIQKQPAFSIKKASDTK